MHDVLVILLFVALGAVLLVLGMGLIALLRGGRFGRQWSNRLMRVRIAVQFTAILILAALIFLVQKTH